MAFEIVLQNRHNRFYVLVTANLKDQRQRSKKEKTEYSHLYKGTGEMREQKPEAQKLTKPTKTKTHSLSPD